jgi:hypothetical protein
MYKATQSQGAPGADGHAQPGADGHASGGQKQDGEVTDVDFEEVKDEKK